MFIHGAWVGPKCWDLFRSFFTAEGLICHAPPWPYDDRPYNELRENPVPELARVGLKDIVDHYEKAAAKLHEAPLLVGHSFGGLVAQLLLERNVGSGAIAIHSAPPRGVFPSLPALRSGFPVLLSLGGWRRVLRTSFDSFAHGFIHNLPPDEQRWVYEEQVIPTPGRPFFQVAFASFNAASKIDFARSGRTPLLIVAGDGDRTVTASMNRANHRRYQRAGQPVDYKEFPGRSHWTIAEPGWEDVARYCLTWAQDKGVI
jgi:pimeloyl-ACP methyl ester carboxylesterase